MLFNAITFQNIASMSSCITLSEYIVDWKMKITEAMDLVPRKGPIFLVLKVFIQVYLAHLVLSKFKESYIETDYLVFVVGSL